MDSDTEKSDSPRTGTDPWFQALGIRLIYADRRLEIWSVKRDLPYKCLIAFDAPATTALLDWMAGLR